MIYGVIIKQEHCDSSDLSWEELPLDQVQSVQWNRDFGIDIGESDVEAEGKKNIPRKSSRKRGKKRKSTPVVTSGNKLDFHENSQISEVCTQGSMRTSEQQFDIMVAYMEKNGDLSKHWSVFGNEVSRLQHWAKLATLLNTQAGGTFKTESQWKKTWADFKNNTKKKAYKIHRAPLGKHGAGTRLKLSPLEDRVMTVVHRATGPLDNSNTVLDSFQVNPSADVDFELIDRTEEESSDAEIEIPQEPSASEFLAPANEESAPKTSKRRRSENPTEAKEPAAKAPNYYSMGRRIDSLLESDRVWKEFLRKKLQCEEVRHRQEHDYRTRKLQAEEKWLEVANKALTILEKYSKKK